MYDIMSFAAGQELFMNNQKTSFFRMISLFFLEINCKHSMKFPCREIKMLYNVKYATYNWVDFAILNAGGHAFWRFSISSHRSLLIKMEEHKIYEIEK